MDGFGEGVRIVYCRSHGGCWWGGLPAGSLLCWLATGAVMCGGWGPQVVPQGLGPRDRTLWLGEESLTSWSSQSCWILCLREPLRHSLYFHSLLNKLQN